MADVPLIDIRPDHWEIVRAILHTHVPQYEVWAFGSRATWQAKPYSDLDLAILTDEPLPLALSAALADAFSESDLPWRVDVLDWATTSPSFRAIVQRDKVVVQKKLTVGQYHGDEMSKWQETKLGNIIQIKHGWPFRSELFSEQLTGRPIIVSIGNFEYTGGFRFENTKNKEYRGEYPREYELSPRDILLVMTCQTSGGEILGIPGRIPSDDRIYLHNQRMGKAVLHRHDLADIDYLYWLFLWKPFNQSLCNSASGTKILHTSPGRIEEFQFSLPPLPTQRAIARILGSLDDKIELNRRQNATLEALARAIFQSWFVDFDPVRAKAEGRVPTEMDAATAALFPDGFDVVDGREVPRGWKTGRLVEIADITMGQSPPGDTYNEQLDGLPFYQGARDFDFRFPDRRVFCTSPTRLAKAGDVLLSVRAPVGRLNVSNEECAIGRGVASLRLRKMHGGFLYYLLLATQAQWEKYNAEGTVFGSVSKDDVQKFPITIPDWNLIQQFNQIIRSTDLRIALNHYQSRTLAALRDTLLPRLLSGELRARAVE